MEAEEDRVRLRCVTSEKGGHRSGHQEDTINTDCQRDNIYHDQWQRFQKYHLTVTESLKPYELLDWFIARELFTQKEADDIKVDEDVFVTTWNFLVHLQMQPPSSMKEFLEGLRETKQQVLADLLDPRGVSITPKEYKKLYKRYSRLEPTKDNQLHTLRKKFAMTYLTTDEKDLHLPESDFIPMVMEASDYTSSGTLLDETLMDHHLQILDMDSDKIIITGDEGIGKTTMMRNLCRDWALEVMGEAKSNEHWTEQQHHLLYSIGIILFIDMQEFTQNDTFKAILQQTMKDKESLGCLENFIKENPSKCTIIFDNASEDEVASDRGIPAGIRCLYTYRNHPEHLESSYVKVVLKGFNVSQSKEYITNHLKNVKSERASMELWIQIAENSEFLTMAKNPSYLGLMCSVLLSYGSLGANQAILLKRYVLSLLQKYYNKLSVDEAKNEKRLEDEYRSMLVNIGNEALESLKQKEKFSIRGHIGVEDQNELRWAVQLLRLNCFQEFLAAYVTIYDTKHDLNRILIEFVASKCDQTRLRNMCFFMSTILESQKHTTSLHTKVSRFLENVENMSKISPEDNTLFIFNLMRNNKKHNVCLPAAIKMDLSNYPSSKILPFGRTSQVHKFFQLNANNVKSINLTIDTKCHLQVLTEIKAQNLDDLCIDFSGNLNKDDVSHLVKFLKRHPGLKSLALVNMNNESRNTCQTDDILLRNKLQSMKHLTQLKFSNCFFGDQKGINKLMQTVAGSNFKDKLEVLDLSDNSCIIDKECIVYIHKLANLQSLNLSGNKELTIEASRLLFRGIPLALSHLCHLSLKNTCIPLYTERLLDWFRVPDYIQADLEGSGLEILNRMFQTFHPELLIHKQDKQELNYDFVGVVTGIPKLTSINLSGHGMQEEVAEVFHFALSTHTALTSLNLEKCNMIINSNLMKTFSELTHLSYLDLSGNRISSVSCEQFDSSLQLMSELTYLDVSDCKMKITQNLMVTLSTLPKITYLRLGNNMIVASPYKDVHMPLNPNLKLLDMTETGHSTSFTNLWQCSELEVLDFDGNPLGLDGKDLVRSLEAAVNLRILSMSKCEGLSDIAKSLFLQISQHCPLFEELDISNNDLSSVGEQLGPSVKDIKLLKKLCVNRCQLNHVGSTKLLENLLDTSSLEFLDMSYNMVSHNDNTSNNSNFNKQLLSFTKKKGNLKGLGVSGCGVNRDVFLEICKNCPSLLHMALADNYLSDIQIESVKMLQGIELCNCDLSDDTCVFIVQCLQDQSPHLCLLGLRYNKLSAGVWKVVQCLSGMKNVERLLLDGNPCVKSKDQREKFHKVLMEKASWVDIDFL